MAEINYIRHESNTKGDSYSSIAKRMGRDPRTVKKYAEMEDFTPKSKGKQTRPAPVMDPVKPILDKWLKEDLNKKKKYRRTAKRMWQQLQEQHDFKGSYRAVRRYVSERKKELVEDKAAALPLESKPGTAQVDFGEAPFQYQGKMIDLPYLVMSFPYSNAFYVQVFQSQNKECFLEGLKRIFHHMGGVPRAIRFDNLSPAVKKILPNGERELTEEFQNFVLHYGFEYEFCNPASGNEKGHVEAMVKYVRNNFFLPEIKVEDLAKLNEGLWQKVEEDRNRPHYDKHEIISRLFAEDLKEFFMLPEKEYEVIRYEKLKADKRGIIQLDHKLYSTSPRFAKSYVLAKISYNTVEILNESNDLIVRHTRLYGDQQKSMNWKPYLTLMAKRPRAIKYTTFYNQLPLEWQQYLEECTVEEQKQALKLLADILKDQDFTKANKALKVASEHGHPSAETIKQVFYQLANGRGHRPVIQVKQSFPLMPNVTRDISRYDNLQRVVTEDA